MGESKKQEIDQGGGASYPAAKERPQPRLEVGLTGFRVQGSGCREDPMEEGASERTALG